MARRVRYPTWPPEPPSSTAPAYATAVILGLCSVLTLVVALIGWDGRTHNLKALVIIPGMAFSGDVTGNVDFAITTSMIIMGVVALLAVLVAARLGFARIAAGIVGGLVTAYYVYAVIKFAVDGAPGEFLLPVIMCLLLWLLATILAFLPLTGDAMRFTELPGHAQW
jgi:hypothetical protein